MWMGGAGVRGKLLEAEQQAEVMEHHSQAEQSLWDRQARLTVRQATRAPCRRPTRTSLQWCLWSDTRV